jgi:heterotetrameric sarcosine oxidase delta subunit
VFAANTLAGRKAASSRRTPRRFAQRWRKIVSFLVRCPHCGNRSVYEFRFGGEVKQRPVPGSPESDWVNYTYTKLNEAGVQKEWWFHRSGCRQWFQALRNTVTNEVQDSFFPEEST